MHEFWSQLSSACMFTGSHYLVSEIMNLDQFSSEVSPISNTAGISGKKEKEPVLLR